MTLTLVTPAEMPVSAAEARENSRIDDEWSDALLERYIAAAMAHAERWTGRKFPPATWDYGISAFPAGPIVLPLTPVVSVSSLAYVDTNDDPQVVTGYEVNGSEVSISGDWPDGSSVVVRFVAGDGAPEDVRQAILLIVGHWYENRTTASDRSINEIPMGARTLLSLCREMFV